MRFGFEVPAAGVDEECDEDNSLIFACTVSAYFRLYWAALKNTRYYLITDRSL